MSIDEARFKTLAALNNLRFAKRMRITYEECTPEELEQLKQEVKQLDELILFVECVFQFTIANQVRFEEIYLAAQGEI